MTTSTTQCQAITTKGKQCSRPAVRDGFCTPHNQRFNTAETVELPAMPEALDDYIEDGGPVLGHAVAATKAGEVGDIKLTDAGVEHVLTIWERLKAAPGPVPVKAICVARKCRLPLGHPGAHGVPAKERVSIGALTGKL